MSIFKKNWNWFLLAGAILIYLFTFTYLSFAKHDYFFSGFRDLGIYDQIIYNTSRGDFFASSLEIVRQAKNNALGLHTEWVLIFFAFIYRFLPNPKVLLFIQTLILSLGALPIYLIARRIFNEKKWALVFPISFLLFPALEWANLFEFHPLTLVATPFLFAFYFAIKGNYSWYLIFLLLSLLIREDVGFMVVSLGVFFFFSKGRKKIGILTIFLGIAWLFLMLKFIIGYYAGGAVSPALSYYGELGKSYGEAIRNLLTNPNVTLPLLLRKQNFIFLAQLFSPLGFISILSPLLILVSLPEFLILLLASKPEMQLINFHYQSFLIPFIFLSVIYGAKFLVNRGLSFQLMAFIILSSSVFSNLWFSPSPLSRRFEKPPYMEPIRAEEMRMALRNVPHDVSLTTNQRLGAHLSQRKEIYMLPEKINEVDYVVLYTGEFEKHPWLISIFPEPQEKAQQMVQKLRQGQKHETIYDEESLVVLRRKK